MPKTPWRPRGTPAKRTICGHFCGKTLPMLPTKLLAAEPRTPVTAPLLTRGTAKRLEILEDGQSDSEEVMSSPTPYRNVTMFPGGSLHTRQIRRNASEEVTSSPTPYRNVTTFPGSSVRNSSRTCIREPLTAVWAGTLNSWMMRKSFRFASIALNRRSLAIPADFGAIART